MNTIHLKLSDKSLHIQIELEETLKDKKTELEKEKGKLEIDKKKKEVEQEKVDKIKRKVNLVKDMAEASFNIAKGVTKALSYGPILGPILATVITVAGAMQLKAMGSQLAKFEDGGMLRGRRHSQGGMRIEGSNIEVEGGEYVVNRQSTDKNLGLIRYINSERRQLSPADISSFFARTSQGFEPPFSRAFEAGGQLPLVDTPSTVDNEQLVDAIRSIRIEPRVAVTDINRVQNEVVSVDNWVGL